jgi:hypothetical protein
VSKDAKSKGAVEDKTEGILIEDRSSNSTSEHSDRFKNKNDNSTKSVSLA